MSKLNPATRIYRGWWIVATGFLSQMGAAGATGWVFGVLILPMQSDLGWSRAEIVGVVTLARVVGGLFAMRLGPLLDRHGARSVMVVSALAATGSMVGTALSQSPLQYYLCWIAFGLAIPGLSTIGPAVAVSNWFIRKRPQALMTYTLGSAAAGLALAPLMTAIANELGWRAAWAVMAAFFAVVAPCAFVAVRRRPEDFGLLPDGASSMPAPAETARVEAEPALELTGTVRQALHSRAFWMLSLAFMLTSFPAASIFIHMPSFVASKGFSSAAGAAALTFYGAGVLAGRFVWSYVVARANIHRALVAYATGYGLSIFLFVFPTSLPAIYATTVLLGIAIAGAQQLNVQAFADYFGRHIVGTLLGYAASMSALTGASAPLLAAAAYDRTNSYELTFSVFGGFCLLAGLAFLFSKPVSGVARAAAKPVPAP